MVLRGTAQLLRGGICAQTRSSARAHLAIRRQPRLAKPSPAVRLRLLSGLSARPAPRLAMQQPLRCGYPATLRPALRTSSIPIPNTRPPVTTLFSTATSTTAAEAIPRPSPRDLRLRFLNAAIPMVAFGFMDQTIMIQVGEAVDATFGVALGLSTLTAAACGQVVSDLSGVAFGGVVESFLGKLRVVPVANIAPAQNTLGVVRAVTTGGAAFGVLIGCLLGMIGLLFMDLDRAEREKRAAELKTIFTSVVQQGRAALHAQGCTLYLLDKEKNQLWSDTSVQGDKPLIISMPASAGLAGLSACSCKVLNVPDAYAHSHFNDSFDRASGFRTGSVLCVPIFAADDHGQGQAGGGGQAAGHAPSQVVGVIQAVNKTDDSGQVVAFTADDERLAAMIASHAAIFLAVLGPREGEN